LQFETESYKMQGYIHRIQEDNILKHLEIFPAVAILGPRQSGKSSTAKQIAKLIGNTLYVDLENYSDHQKIEAEPQLFFSTNKDKTIILDEIQKLPEIFSLLRALIDQDRRNGWLIMLGSASPDLLKQSSQSLAGRIGYLELTPFSIREVQSLENFELRALWMKGGFPMSFLQPDEASFIWRMNYLVNIIERDFREFGFDTGQINIRRLLSMLAHYHGQIINLSVIGKSLGISHVTVQKYIDIFEKIFLVRLVQPYFANLGKRIVKSPKLYFRDSGILHSLLNIRSFNELLGHPSFGASWEGFAMENIIASLPGWQPWYYRTATGVEIDLILERGLRKVAVEIKASTAPTLGKGFFIALDDLKIGEAWVIAPVDTTYPIHPKVKVSGLKQFLENFKE
jgi:uncharacterized protein